MKNIGHKILLLVGVAVILGLVAVLMVYTQHQEESLLHQNERAMELLTESVSGGLQTVMLAGYADIAQEYSDNLKQVSRIRDFRILRMDGREAFRDNITINAVNTLLESDHFPKRKEQDNPQIVSQDIIEQFKHIDDKGSLTIYGTGEDGQPQLSFYAAIEKRSACYGCHGEGESQGVMKLTTSLAPVYAEIDDARKQATVVGAVAIILILGLTYILIRRSVVGPITRVTAGMSGMASGNLTERIPVIGDDELSQMANSFNQMGDALKESHDGLQTERDKLTTIILGAREGMVATNSSGKIVLVNPAAEKLLSKSFEELVEGGFENIIDDPDYVHAYLSSNGVGMPETHVYKGRVLHFYATTIRDANLNTVGSAALIRDVTEEKRLEEQLRTLSNTDGLTGLLNRRRMDEILAQEHSRARRYKQELGVLLFDVDHFKKFNDTYGHDQGDRVLQALAEAMKDHFRNVDFPCRYGGEEFVVILPSCGIEGSKIAAERFRERIENMVVDGLKVTISIGISVYPYHNIDNAELMLKAADEALYQGKKAGRNCVKLADKDAPTGEAEE
ncbi:MAG: diguanylate cyclase [Magnetococcales bacterium]|nr:diguanylate cyclase [Magnetococcales bacterium]